MKLKKYILFISGPTSSGKSFLSLKIAQKINGEIINADSMQVYQDLNIITDRPSKYDQRIIQHHLYGHISGGIRYNVNNWCKECSKKISRIEKKNKIPIVVGGTGLYFSSIINGISKIPEIPEDIKNDSLKELNKYGWNKLYRTVKKFDNQATLSLNKNDNQRLRRIWEVMQYTGIPLSKWRSNSNVKYINDYKFKLILILPEKQKLYKKCNNRFLKMIDDGGINEVKKLMERGFDSSLPIMKAHGVPEIIEYLLGNISLKKATERAQKVTRNYIKRQFKLTAIF